MLFFFLSSMSNALAQDQTLYSWLSDENELQDFTSFDEQNTPSSITKSAWDQSSPKAYSRALFSEPSLLSLLNQYQIKHKLLPTVDNPVQHDILLFQQAGKSAQLMYQEKQLETVFFIYERSGFVIDPNPFSPSRFSSIEREINTLLSSCARRKILKQDSYGNSLSWKGEDCFFGDLLLTYQPTESYPLQAVFYAQD